MENLVTLTTHVPEGTPEETAEQVRTREAARSRKLAALRPPKVTEKPVPVFTSVELSELQKACQGRTFAGRRDAAVIAAPSRTSRPGRRPTPKSSPRLLEFLLGAEHAVRGPSRTQAPRCQHA